MRIKKIVSKCFQRVGVCQHNRSRGWTYYYWHDSGGWYHRKKVAVQPPHRLINGTALSVLAFIRKKTPQEVVENVMQYRGEFNNEKIRSSTPGESPWSNRLCERNHQSTERMLEILAEENLKSDKKILLGWTNVAKNSLQMWNGLSSYQLAPGKNPNLPNIMTEKLPALQGVTTSEILKYHLNAMHSARKAFIKCEADEKIRRALHHPIRATVETFNPAKLFFKMARLF